MIRDVAHAHDDTTRGMMAIVSSDVSLYTTFMGSADDTDDFYRTFLAMVETINVHGGSAGYNPQLYKDHYYLLCKEREIDVTLTTVKKVAIEKAKKDAKKASCEEYLACLFI